MLVCVCFLLLVDLFSHMISICSPSKQHTVLCVWHALHCRRSRVVAALITS